MVCILFFPSAGGCYGSPSSRVIGHLPEREEGAEMARSRVPRGVVQTAVNTAAMASHNRCSWYALFAFGSTIPSHRWKHNT